MNDDDSEKYLDPEQNPMILTGEPAEPDGEPDKYLDPKQNPMIPGGDAVAHDLTMLNKRIAAAFPGQNEISIGSRILVRMASGTFTEKESGKKIAELPMADLLAIDDFLKDREKS